MSDPIKSPLDPTEEPAPAARLPYEGPAVIWEQPLESLPSLMAGCTNKSAAAMCLVPDNS